MGNWNTRRFKLFPRKSQVVKKSCIIAPIHAPHFISYGIDFISSYNHYFNDSDVFLIFSSKEESDQFKLISGDLRHGSIICDEPIGPSPITQKKIFGLKYIFNNTDFDKVGVIDADTAFIKYVDYDKCFEEYIGNKKIYTAYSTKHPHVNGIIKSPTKFFNEEDVNKIKELTHEFKGYFWFNDIPVYSKQYFLDFIQYINYEENKNKLEYIDFDFIMYGYYLLVKDLATLEFLKINNEIIDLPYGFLEQQHLVNENEFEKIIQNYNPMWLKIDTNPEFMKNVFIRLHIHSPYK